MYYAGKEPVISSSAWPEAEFLDKIQTKVLRVFLLAIRSPLQLCFEIYIYLNPRNLLQFLQFS
jgi:hypothetical protein